MKLREFGIERFYARHEFTTPYQLSASDCESLRVEEVLAYGGRSTAELLGLPLAYVETRGTNALREAIAGFYPGCGPEDVLVCNAPQEAIFLAMLELLEPGARVVVMTPCYQSLKEVARSLGCEVVEWRVRASAAGWELDLDELDGLLAKGTRLLVTNAPHNPTGLQPSAAQWERMRELVVENGVRWFSDEMYRGLEPSGQESRVPAACLSSDAVSLWGMSKSFGLPGLRIGWLVARDADLLRRVEARKDYTSICSNAAGEYLASVALRAAAPILARHRARIAENTGHVQAFMERHAERFLWRPPMAGPVALVQTLDELASAHAERLRLESGVLLVPSTLFDLEDSYLRVGLGRENLPEALARWERAEQRS